MDNYLAPRQAPSAWTRAIDEGRADVAAGRTFDFDETMAEFEREDAAFATRPARGSAKV